MSRLSLDNGDSAKWHVCFVAVRHGADTVRWMGKHIISLGMVSLYGLQRIGQRLDPSLGVSVCPVSAVRGK